MKSMKLEELRARALLATGDDFIEALMLQRYEESLLAMENMVEGLRLLHGRWTDNAESIDVFSNSHFLTSKERAQVSQEMGQIYHITKRWESVATAAREAGLAPDVVPREIIAVQELSAALTAHCKAGGTVKSYYEKLDAE